MESFVKEYDSVKSINEDTIKSEGWAISSVTPVIVRYVVVYHRTEESRRDYEDRMRRSEFKK